MKENSVLKIGELVQLSPVACKNPMFAGCIMAISEPKAFGAQGFVQSLGENGKPGGQAYYRAHWDEMEATGGFAVWLPEGTLPEEESAES